MKTSKQKHKDRNGKQVISEYWYLDFHDRHGTRRRLKAYTHKNLSAQLGRDIEMLMANNGRLKTDEDIKWFTNLKPSIRAKLLEWGIVDSRTTSNHISTPLREHLKVFIETRHNKNCDLHHIRQTESSIRRIIAGCGFRMFSDIDGTAVESFVAEGRSNNGYGQGTYNSHIQAIKTFTKWLCDERQLTPNPLARIKLIKKTIFRKLRRTLSRAEKSRLLRATYDGLNQRRFSTPHYERYLVYRLALETGLRYSEIRALKVLSFDLVSDIPTVTTLAADSKGKETDCLALNAQYATELKTFFANKSPTAPAFSGLPHKTNAARMLRADLAVADIEYRDAAGRDIDFHSLRHTFITDLFLAGVAATVVQKLARHKDLKTTMCYSHVRREDTVNAIQRLGEQTASDITMFRPISDQNHTQIRTDMESSGKETAMKIPKRAVSA